MNSLEDLKHHYVVALSSAEESFLRMQMCLPTLILKSELQIKKFVGQCDYYLSDIEVSQDIHKHLDKCGCPRDNRLLIIDLEDAPLSLSIRLSQIALGKANAALARLSE
jgi:hypothetical protein